MKLRLKSNFFELWHAAFDSEGLEFRLMTNEGPNRIEMFNLFRKLGILAPLFGKHGDFIRFKYDVDRHVVIYDDINMHFGEKKRLVKFKSITTFISQFNHRSRHARRWLFLVPRSRFRSTSRRASR